MAPELSSGTGLYIDGAWRAQSQPGLDVFSLAAYLFTRDLGRAYRIGEGLDFGMVAVKDGALGWVQAPFAGIKGSGDGREGGRWGLEEFLDVQYLSFNF